MKNKVEGRDTCLEIQIMDKDKLVEVWLAKDEKANLTVQGYLQKLYAQFRAKKYTVAVYVSGDGDLFQDTLALLRYNRRRSTEQAVETAKGAR